MRAVDTNVLLRLVTRDNPEQARLADAYISGGAWVSHLALAECAWALGTLYQRSHDKIADSIEMLLGHVELTLQDPETVAAAVALYRRRPGLGFSDCFLLEIARKAGHLPLGSFDRDLAKLPDVERL
jgi:predicted nucleic acid-binding protein